MSAIIYGKCDQHIDCDALERPVHVEVVEDLTALKNEAKAAGFSLALASGYRNFDRQCAIWNAKVKGDRPVLDSNEQPIDVSRLSEKEIVFSILRWTALPGTSRHHWGTDVDVFDRGALKNESDLQLTVAETESGGPFYPFYEWLNDYLKDKKCKFFRPYAKDLGGVSAEPWHLSYKPLAQTYERAFDLEELKKHLRDSNLLLKSLVMESLDEIYRRFVINICKP